MSEEEQPKLLAFMDAIKDIDVSVLRRNIRKNGCLYTFLEKNRSFTISDGTHGTNKASGLINNTIKKEISEPPTPEEFMAIRGKTAITGGFNTTEINYMLQFQDMQHNTNSHLTIFDNYTELRDSELPIGKDFVVCPVYIWPADTHSDGHFVTAILTGKSKDERKVKILDSSHPKNGVDYAKEDVRNVGKIELIENSQCNQGTANTCGFYCMAGCMIASSYQNINILEVEIANKNFQKTVQERVTKWTQELQRSQFKTLDEESPRKSEIGKCGEALKQPQILLDLSAIKPLPLAKVVAPAQHGNESKKAVSHGLQ